jgi:hypothetical protein
LPTSESDSKGKAYALVGGLAIVLIVLILYFVKASQSADPCAQPIRVASGTVEVAVVSDEDINTTYIDRGAYAAFGNSGNEPLLLMSSRQCSARQNGDGQVVYRAEVSMDVSDTAFGKPLLFLEEARYIQLGFLPMPEQSQVAGGEITCIFNSDIVLELSIPEQETADGKVFVRGLELNCGAD